MRDYCVYRYTLRETNEVIYIGKTDASLKQRIDAHQKEDNFAPYLGLWDIDYLELENSTETDIVEKYLINLYKPILNTKDNVPGITKMHLTLPEWRPYRFYEENKKHANEIAIKIALQQAKIDDEFLCALAGSSGNPFTLDFCHTGYIGKISFTEKEAIQTDIIEKDLLHRNKIRYQYTYYPANLEYLEDHFEELEELCFHPVAILWDFQEQDEKKLSVMTKVLDILEDIETFARDGFQIEDYEKDEYVLECSPECISYLEGLFYNIYGDNGHYYATVNETKINEIDKIRCKIAKDRLKIYAAAGIHNQNEIYLQIDPLML